MHLYRYGLINKMYRLRREPCEHDLVKRAHIYRVIVEVNQNSVSQMLFSTEFHEQFLLWRKIRFLRKTQYILHSQF